MSQGEDFSDHEGKLERKLADLNVCRSSTKQYPTVAEGYEVYQVIGEGAFANVYRAIAKDTKEEVAIKVINLDHFNTNWDEIRREILVMRTLAHPNIVEIYASFVEESDLWIVMPLLSGGSCASIMRKLCQKGFKDEALIATILRETLKGLIYFHQDGKIHRDVKAGNILVSDKGDIKLADFGVAGTLMDSGERKKIRRTFTGTPCWMAPEVMEQNGYDTRADIWSFGITVMELGYGRAPYAKFDPMKVLMKTLQEEPPTCDIYEDQSVKFSSAYYSLISKCLKKDPKSRPSASRLLEHRFFKKARDASYIVEKLIAPQVPLPDLKTLKPLLLTRIKGRGAEEAEIPEKDRAISVESFVLDDDELATLKAQAMGLGEDGQPLPSAPQQAMTPEEYQAALALSSSQQHQLYQAGNESLSPLGSPMPTPTALATASATPLGVAMSSAVRVDVNAPAAALSIQPPTSDGSVASAWTPASTASQAAPAPLPAPSVPSPIASPGLGPVQPVQSIPVLDHPLSFSPAVIAAAASVEQYHQPQPQPLAVAAAVDPTPVPVSVPVQVTVAADATVYPVLQAPLVPVSSSHPLQPAAAPQEQLQHPLAPVVAIEQPQPQYYPQLDPQVAAALAAGLPQGSFVYQPQSQPQPAAELQQQVVNVAAHFPVAVPLGVTEYDYQQQQQQQQQQPQQVYPVLGAYPLPLQPPQ